MIFTVLTVIFFFYKLLTLIISQTLISRENGLCAAESQLIPKSRIHILFGIFGVNSPFK